VNYSLYHFRSPAYQKQGNDTRALTHLKLKKLATESRDKSSQALVGLMYAFEARTVLCCAVLSLSLCICIYIYIYIYIYLIIPLMKTFYM
jgi:hypothetical protein